MPLDAKHLFASGGPSGFSYDLEIGAVQALRWRRRLLRRGLHRRQGHSVFGKRVKVKGAIRRPASSRCPVAASCSPPQIDFLVGGIRYTIQANLNSHEGDRTALIAAAESAISAGPR